MTGFLAVCAWSLPPLAIATDIKLKNGAEYLNATIRHQDAHTLEVQVQFGVISIPITQIESIDGAPLTRPIPPVPTNGRPAEAGITNERASTASAAKPKTKKEAPPRPPYVHGWTMDIFLIGFVAIAGAWIATLLWVQKDIDDRHGSERDVPKKWNTIVLLLPVAGLVMYIISRTRELRAEGAVEAATEQAAAGLDIAEPQQKPGLFGGRTKVTQPAKRKQKIGFEFLDEDGNPIEIRKDLPEMTGIEAAREVLEEAIMDRASDVHVEPQEKQYKVRFRVDGVLQERLIFEKTDGLRVISSLKTLSRIDVAEKRKAQDGRFRVRTGVRDVDFRVSTATSIFGEKMVLRILDRKGGRIGLAAVGMSEQMLTEFNRVLHSRSGIILATGPTGSGKTSSLYAAISQLDAARLNIMSIEDPVEYELAGATQIPVNVKAGVTYENGLRSILRQDPDVIFLGEIRDKMAAEIAVRAALTGHLMFTSLHTRDAISSVMRLKDLGVETYQVSSALLMVVAQRLVRVLCKECRESYMTKGNELADIGVTLPVGKLIYRSKGCGACDNTGYQGRTGIFELLVVDEELRNMINEGSSQQAQSKYLRDKGFRSYREDGADKVIKGITSIEEVLSAS